MVFGIMEVSLRLLPFLHTLPPLRGGWGVGLGVYNSLLSVCIDAGMPLATLFKCCMPNGGGTSSHCVIVCH